MSINKHIEGKTKEMIDGGRERKEKQTESNKRA